MSAYNDTIGILEKYKIKANKDLGQNFLINDDVNKAKIIDVITAKVISTNKSNLIISFKRLVLCAP